MTEDHLPDTKTDEGLLEDLYGRSRFQNFEDLMSSRVENIILVSSLYDKFILQEDGHLSEVILGEFLDLQLHHTTGLTHVSTGKEAVEIAKKDPHSNLVITAIRVGDMNAAELARTMRKEGLDIPVIVLAYDAGELADFTSRHDIGDLERLFLWQGDTRILLAIIKYVEDRMNVVPDVLKAGVQVILVIEDNIRYYSSFLPVMFSEVIRHSQRLLPEGINVAHKILRMRARPKIVHCLDFDEAWDYFNKFPEDVLGVISDMEFQRNGETDAQAGLEFARGVLEAWPDVPIVLQSSNPENETLADSVGADFLVKNSPTFLQDLRTLMVEQFSFGEFIFRMPDRKEIGRASNMRTLIQKLQEIPDESLVYHAERNHFSRWLKARAEFALAHRLRPGRVSDFGSAQAMRQHLVTVIEEYRREQSDSLIADFNRRTFDTTSSFTRLGGGSLGGKARALAFVRYLLHAPEMEVNRPADVTVTVPPSLVMGTDVFDSFLRQNRLQDFATETDDEDLIISRFLSSSLPEDPRDDLESYLSSIRYPLAVRSSSLLDDSLYQPLAGVYQTIMLPNNHPDLTVRTKQLEHAIKLIYASAFSQHAKNYFHATPYRLEEEKMAVLIQKMVGKKHGSRFYPDFSGVARSYNFYPTGPAEAEDGMVTLALGLGRTVVSGGKAMSFCPRYPEQTVDLPTVSDVLQNSQKEFWAMELPEADKQEGEDMWEQVFGLDTAEQDGVLDRLASTYSPENDTISPGTSRPGQRLITFSPLIKYDLFPLAKILYPLLRLGEEGMGMPVEIEFAVNLPSSPDEEGSFSLLQIRPMGMAAEGEELNIGDIDPSRILCHSGNILGNGEIRNIRDLIVVDPGTFRRADSHHAAREIARVNAQLTQEERHCVLIGPGRWGSADRWLGIPVAWDEIATARVIVEAELEDMVVSPSQGTHFFQNLTSFRVGYFTVDTKRTDDRVDWDWLKAQVAVRDGDMVKHLRFEEPLEVRMDGTKRRGVILKPRTS